MTHQYENIWVHTLFLLAVLFRSCDYFLDCDYVKYSTPDLGSKIGVTDQIRIQRVIQQKSGYLSF